MPTPARVRYLRAELLAGNLDALGAAQGITADETTRVQYAALGTATQKRFTPRTTQTAEAQVPASGAAPSNRGWRDNAAEQAGARTYYQAGDWVVTLRAQKFIAEVVPEVRFTPIIYEVTSAGTFVREIGRGNSGLISLSAGTVQTVTVTIPFGEQNIAANNRIQVEIYTTTFVLGAEAAPTTEIDYALVLGEAASTGTRLETPQYVRKVIAGVTRDAAGTGVSGATVKAMRESDDVKVETATSAADGAYKLQQHTWATDTYYVIGAKKNVTPTIQGVSESGLTAVTEG